MLTTKGYERPTYDDILNSLILKAQELFGEDIDTDDQTPLGKFIRIIAYDRATAEEEAEAIYYARFPNTASGTSLDRLCPFVGITRNSAIPSQYEITVTGTAGHTVPYGFLVATDAEVEFYNTQDTVIGEDGTCVITVECTENGTIGNVNYSDITEIVNPDADIDEVAGKSVVTAGEDEESDHELRQRFKQAGQGLGSCNQTAIESALIRVPNVSSAKVIVNESDTTDSGGRPPHSFTAYITGGVGYEEQIAETIFDKKPIGIKTYGSISQEITDEGGYTHTIYFARTENVNVTVKIKVDTTAEFESNGTDKIKSNIAEYINGLGVGNSVIYSALYSYIYSVAGVKKVTLLQVSTNGTTFTTDDITIGQYQSAVCASVNVEVA